MGFPFNTGSGSLRIDVLRVADAREGEVHHRAHHLGVHAPALEEERHRDRAHHQVRGQLEVEVWGDFGARDGAFEGLDERLAPSLAHWLEELRQLGIVRAFARQARQHRGERCRVEDLEVAAQHLLQVFGEVARVHVFEAGQLTEGLHHQRELRRPAPVDGGLAHPGAIRDALHRQCREAHLHQQLEGGVQDGLVGLLASRAAGARAGVAAGTHGLSRSPRRFAAPSPIARRPSRCPCRHRCTGWPGRSACCCGAAPWPRW